MRKRRCMSHRRYVTHRMAELSNEIFEDAMATGKVNLEKRQQLLKYKQHFKILKWRKIKLILGKNTLKMNT